MFKFSRVPAPSSLGLFRALKRASGLRLPHWVRFEWPTAFLCALLLLPLISIHAQADTEYKLGPQDKLRIKVYEWRATVDQVYEWSSLNAEFLVGASGNVSLPILGEIPAAGRTTSEVAKLIGDRMKDMIGLAVSPNVAVEVLQYRPFYIIGGVNKPGEYPYRPGLTVLQALSIAGGLLGTGESGLRFGREMISSQGDVQQYSIETQALLARKARLQAEVDSADKITFPPELERLNNNRSTTLMMQQETAIFEARRNALKTQIDAFEQLKDYLNKEIVSLQAQLKTQQDERDIIKRQLTNISGLVEKGLAALPRQLELERTTSQLEGERLRLETTLLRARQDISRTDISIVEVRNKYRTDAASELRETQTKLEQAINKLDTAGKLVYEAQLTSSQASLGLSAQSVRQPVYTLIRQTGGQQQEFNVNEAEAIQPGDTLKVDLRLSDVVSSFIPAATQQNVRQ